MGRHGTGSGEIGRSSASAAAGLPQEAVPCRMGALAARAHALVGGNRHEKRFTGNSCGTASAAPNVSRETAAACCGRTLPVPAHARVRASAETARLNSNGRHPATWGNPCAAAACRPGTSAACFQVSPPQCGKALQAVWLHVSRETVAKHQHTAYYIIGRNKPGALQARWGKCAVRSGSFT